MKQLPNQPDGKHFTNVQSVVLLRVFVPWTALLGLFAAACLHIKLQKNLQVSLNIQRVDGTGGGCGSAYLLQDPAAPVSNPSSGVGTAFPVKIGQYVYIETE